MKIYLKVLTVLACAYLLTVSILNLLDVYRLQILSNVFLFIFLYFIPKMIYVIYIVLSIFVLFKLFLPKRILIRKMSGGILGVCGILQIAAVIAYCVIDYPYLYVYSNTFFLALLRIVAVDLLMMLICVNTFKKFISNKAALIICTVIFTFSIVTYFVEFYTTSFVYGAVNARYLINTIIIMLVSVLTNISCLRASYFGLKTNETEKIQSDNLQDSVTFNS